MESPSSTCTASAGSSWPFFSLPLSTEKSPTCPSRQQLLPGCSSPLRTLTHILPDGLPIGTRFSASCSARRLSYATSDGEPPAARAGWPSPCFCSHWVLAAANPRLGPLATWSHGN